MREVNKLKGKGFDFWSHCKKRIVNGDDSRFWFDCWIRDVPLRVKFPRLFALDLNKEASVAVKLIAPIDVSFRRKARVGLEEHLLADLTSLMDSVTLSNLGDRWTKADKEIWTSAEEVALAKAWIHISTCKKVGIEQGRDKMWERILEHFIEGGGSSTRTRHGLNTKWKTMNAAMGLFNGLYIQQERDGEDVRDQYCLQDESKMKKHN
ncbi:myb-like domain, Myb/SANT-like DNA-binding domain protein [Artemisia annua]|uniref:Myb-like domain, Myb/SANT-like DNA-binding domain protein n=1 Tax=Artemisia annua TaxID=35608 RepID=A0A2U1LH87_ARTAN|nr:myb-like domain, Myb/SANT-like DNA-binding domain protein [Artemisia annua]